MKPSPPTASPAGKENAYMQQDALELFPGVGMDYHAESKFEYLADTPASPLESFSKED